MLARWWCQSILSAPSSPTVCRTKSTSVFKGLSLPQPSQPTLRGGIRPQWPKSKPQTHHWYAPKTWDLVCHLSSHKWKLDLLGEKKKRLFAAAAASSVTLDFFIKIFSSPIFAQVYTGSKENPVFYRTRYHPSVHNIVLRNLNANKRFIHPFSITSYSALRVTGALEKIPAVLGQWWSCSLVKMPVDCRARTAARTCFTEQWYLADCPLKDSLKSWW